MSGPLEAGHERGSATVFAAVAIAGLMLVGSLVVQVGAAEIARHRATGAADLAALAAAATSASGGSDHGTACDRARWVADQMAVDLVGCRFDGPDALVEVTAAPGGLLGGYGTVTARARAGPVQLTADERPAARPAAVVRARATVVQTR